MAKAKYTKQKNGYFQARVWDGSYVNGKKHYITIRSKKSSKDLETKVAAYNDKIKNLETVRDKNILFLDYAGRWLTVYKAEATNNTKRMYRNIIEKHLRQMDGVRLCDVLPIHYQTVLNDAAGKKRIQQQIQLTFSQIMKAAVHDRLYPANLLEDLKDVMKPIDYKADEKRPLTENEKNAMVKAELSPSDRIFVDILYCTGLRCGEVLALTRFDIDFSEKVINVNKSIEFDDAGKPSIKEPKSKNGFRQVPIPQQLYTSLESYVRFCMKGTLLFSMQGGKMVSKSSYRRKWERIIKEMNRVAEKPVCGLTAHIFRHNYCTSLCYQIPRISIKNIASLLGDDEAMVLRIYNHIMLEKEDTAGAVEAALSM
ncbi:tyrosine-type recombinase/integrase [Roseburia hominis]|jgi:integrase|nr:MAG TPA: Integrase [Caudoviricetes sp.]